MISLFKNGSRLLVHALGRPLLRMLVLMTVPNYLLLGQSVSETVVKRRLSDPAARQAFIDSMAASPSTYVPVLVKLAARRKIDSDQLTVGLVEAFGRLRCEKGIPFLIDRIGVQVSGDPHVWMKTAESIESQYPAIRALRLIGAPAVRPLVEAANSRAWTQFQRLPLAFALARVLSQEQSGREGLRSFLSLLDTERRIVEQELRNTNAQNE